MTRIRFTKSVASLLKGADHLLVVAPKKAFEDGSFLDVLPEELMRLGIDLASLAVDMNRPREAVEALQSIDPDRGELQGWAQYWTELDHAHHLLGEHDAEADAARQMRQRYPERRIALVLEIRARAAQGRTDLVEALLEEGRTLSDRTYWSLGGGMVVAAEEMKAQISQRMKGRATKMPTKNDIFM